MPVCVRFGSLNRILDFVEVVEDPADACGEPLRDEIGGEVARLLPSPVRHSCPRCFSPGQTSSPGQASWPG